MTWELYEVWAVDQDGHEELIDTTKVLKDAKKIALDALTDDIDECVIYSETEDGDLVEVERISK
jgi:hypothetical protein